MSSSSVISPRRLGRPTLQLTLFLLLLLLHLGPAGGCGPGRGAGRRRGPRKMTPLVFKQHVPNVSENTLGASGLAEGRIDRTDPRFADLAVNYNPEIAFKDEEGTGADRIMSHRCKDKLTTLAISVMNQWPGVRLRVTEAWDEDSHHAKDSLHYEGRAVDITTSDRDKSKYGMLARLAVEAGFDWVYYESRGHIHCSVKSDSSITIKTGGCFPSVGTAYLEGGIPTSMSRLSVGDKVLAVDDNGHLVYSEIILFFHRSSASKAVYHTLTLDNGQQLTLTPSHLLYSTNNPNSTFATANAVYAQNVREGSYVYVRTPEQDRLVSVRVVHVRAQLQEGLHAPLTRHGTIMVDNVAVSCYAWIESQNIAHAALSPVRLYHSMFSFWRGSSSILESTVRNNGSHVIPVKDHTMEIHWYAALLYKVAPLVLPSHWLYSTL